MALTKTTLAAPCSDSDLKLRVTSSVGATPGCLVLVGGEYMYCTSVDTPTNISVRGRGSAGGISKAHGNLAPVTFGLGADFGNVPPGQSATTSYDWDVRDVSVTGGFDPGVGGANVGANTEVIIGGAAAVTLPITAPSQGNDGVEVRFVQNSNFAHKLTCTAPVLGGATVQALMAAAGGSSVTLRAQNGQWTIIGQNGITLS